VQFSEEDLGHFRMQLCESDWQAIRQQRFLLQQQLGTLSSVKPVRSAQVAADEASKRLQRAHAELERKREAANVALQAAYEQQLHIDELQVELNELVAKAQRAVAEPPPSAQQAAAEEHYNADITKYKTLVQTVADSVGGVDLGELAGPLASLIKALNGDVAACEAAAAPPAAAPAAAAPDPGAAPPRDAAPAAGGGDGEHKAAGDEDEDMAALNLTPEAFEVATESFCKGDAEKRKWLEGFRAHVQGGAAGKKAKLG